jgi:hypothetical protein
MLSMALQKEFSDGMMQQLKVTHNAPGISHLLSADDALLFFKAETGQAERVKEVLHLFQAGTGQALSPSKC